MPYDYCEPFRFANCPSGEARAARGTGPFPDRVVHHGVGLDLLSRGKRDSQLASAAYLNLSIAAATVIPTALAGLIAWHFALDGMRIKGLLLFHIVAAWLAVVLVIFSWWLHWRARKSRPEILPRVRIPFELFAVAVLGLTAHWGAFLVA
jgi:uncharacterized membrane protein